MASKKTEGALDFGKAYAELESIIEWFEDEEVDLDEGIKRFERGLELAKACKARLSEVENKVRDIKAKFDDLDEDDEGEQ